MISAVENMTMVKLMNSHEINSENYKKLNTANWASTGADWILKN